MTALIHRYHDTRRSPVALYQLNETLNDVSGNGLNLSLGAGTLRYTDIFGYRGVFFNNSTYLAAANNALLQLTGAMSIELIASAASTATRRTLVYHGNPGVNTTADNVLYQCSIEQSSGSLRFASESGSGVVASTSFNDGCQIRTLYHLAFTRSAGGLVKAYINGERFGSDVTLALPTGGASGVLRIGGGEASAFHLGFICSVQIIASELSAEQVLEDATYTGFALSENLTSDHHFPQLVGGARDRFRTLTHPEAPCRDISPSVRQSHHMRRR